MSNNKNPIYDIISKCLSIISKDENIDIDATKLDEHCKSTIQPKQTQIIKKYDDEAMQAIEPLYCAPLEADLHGQGMTESEIRKMVDDINQNISNISGNIGHAYNTEGFYFVKAWVNECECRIGDELVVEGQPIIKVQFTDEHLWDLRKTNQLNGLSIGALGSVVDNPDYADKD